MKLYQRLPRIERQNQGWYPELSAGIIGAQSVDGADTVAGGASAADGAAVGEGCEAMGRISLAEALAGTGGRYPHQGPPRRPRFCNRMTSRGR
ncbi:hypothetical protein ACFWIY_23690 [Streptomyces sioyaensis]|uniref:hypothetical protein n=1 Tax=Streptomyces sioyaensis TaxID=67364 RepID=UPI00364C94D2